MRIRFTLALLFGLSLAMQAPAKSVKSSSYDALLTLFADWRAFEQPPQREGAPDYTAARFEAAHAKLPSYQKRLRAIDRSDWSAAQQVDWALIEAEMHGFDFNHRVLKPWVRDPAFYQTLFMEESDVPAHEGPTNHATLEVWQYALPLHAAGQARMAKELAVIPPLLTQARENLTGNARDLWIAGIRNIEQQRRDLDTLETMIGASGTPAITANLSAAREASDAMADWLKKQAENKTGPSGVGKENYTWYQQHVHRVPLTWQQEVDLLQRELDRAWSSLKLEEQRNRDLPPLVAANTPEDFAALTDKAVARMMAFLETKAIMPIKPNMEPALRAQMGAFVPEAERNFFAIGLHYDPLPLYSHFYHWFELAQIRDEPHASPIRRGPLLYNIWDSRMEGMATGVEEMFMHAGAGQSGARALDAATVDAARARAVEIRAAPLPAPTGIWHQLRGGQIPAGTLARTCHGAERGSRSAVRAA